MESDGIKKASNPIVLSAVTPEACLRHECAMLRMEDDER